MKKFSIIIILIVVLFSMSILLMSCGKKSSDKADTEKVIKENEKRVETTSDTAVDTVNDDLNGIDDVEEELGTGDLEDLDSGLSDVENI